MDQSYEVSTEAGLWSDFINGKEESLHHLYNRYIQELYHYGCHLTYDHDLVRDCIQDVFIDLQEYRNGLTKTNNDIRLYLFKSLKHRIFSNLNHQNSFKDSAIGWEVSWINPFEDEIIDHETRNQIRSRLSTAFTRLSFRQKEALYLKFISNLSYKEIGLVLNLNYQSTRNLIFRALEKLRECHRNLLILSFSFLPNYFLDFFQLV